MELHKNIDISIVMAYHNRKDQTLITLKSISSSEIKNFEVIIIDDGSDEEHDIKSYIKEFNFKIKLVKINKKEKQWLNPCVPYNIGLKMASGKIIIIQNPEVCHVGDIMKYVYNNIKNGTYLTFSVYSSPSFDHNKIFESIDKNNLNEVHTNFIDKINYENYKFDYEYYKNKYNDISNLEYNAAHEHWINKGNIENRICNKSGIYYPEAYMKWKGWYNHPIYNNRSLHFLSAITKNDLTKIGGFNINLKDGLWYDDDDLLYRIKKICNVYNVDTKICFGIHLYHTNGSINHITKKMKRMIIKNKYIFKRIQESNTLYIDTGCIEEYKKYEFYEN